MPIIMPNQALVLNAYAVLVDETPGNVNLKDHIAFIEANGVSMNGVSIYRSTLDGIFAEVPTATLAATMLANLGLTNVFTQELAEAYLTANAGNRVGAMLDLASALYYYSGDNAVYTAAHDAYKAVVEGSYDYSILPANAAGAELDSFNGTTFTLTVSQDTLSGTSLDDTFTANVVQNSLGAQVNTLGSGDILNGGAGDDTLFAKITAGAYIGGSYSMPIQPETSGIETAVFQAVQSSVSSGYFGDVNTQVYVNAKDMVDLTTVSSTYSDADLTIQNLTTKTSSGGTNLVSEMTVEMAYSGNNDSAWDESDLTVYFDQDYLTPQATSSDAAIEIRVMNEDAYDEGAAPLAGVVLYQFSINVNGTKYDLAKYLGEDMAGDGTEISTYADLLTAVKAALVQLKAATAATDANYAAIQSLEANLGGTFTTDISPITGLLREGTAVEITVDGMNADGSLNTLSVAASDLQLARAQASEVGNNNRYERAENDPATGGEILSINVDLEKVGLAGDGGELVIGSMNKTDENKWGAVNTTTDTLAGIQEFDVTVHGANDKSSSLSGLHSTNNVLEIVKIVTDAAQTSSYADLTIGNSNTDEELGATPSLNNAEALKDVQILDASGFKGDLSVYAALTSEVTAKYLDLQDEAPAAATADDVDFKYTGGTGDDYFNVALDTSNLEANGSVTRADMNLTVDGGLGDDAITLAMVDDDGLAAGVKIPNGNAMNDWYDNQKLNANVSIAGGEGNDTIWTPGSGDVIINGGSGDDTVYADNTGAMAVWAFNVADPIDPLNTVAYNDRHQLTDLQSDTNETYNLYNAALTVTFQGFEVSVTVPSANGKATDAEINQAIKLAINSDAVLSKLLVAADGPANTLVVKSLVDADLDAGDLTVALAAPTTLTASEITQLAGWYNMPGATLATLQAYMATSISAFNTNGDYASSDFAKLVADDIDGGISSHVSDNTITGGTGDDVLVLGTGTFSNDTLVYTGFGNGVDTIVNFDDGVQTTVTTDIIDTGRDESFTVTFNNLTATAATAQLSFDGVTIALNNVAGGVIPGVDVALAFAEQYSGAGWTVSYADGSNSVTLTSTAVNSDVTPDVAAAAFTFANATGTVGISNYVQGMAPYAAGTAATAEVVTAQYDPNGLGTDTAVGSSGVINVLGTNVSLVAGDGAVTVAAKVAAAAFADWTAVLGADKTSVEFTAKATGDVATDAVAADVGSGTLGVAASVVVVDGTAAVAATGGTWTDVTTVTTHLIEGLDYIDFTDYAAKAVYVNGALIDGAAAVAGQNYIALVENTANAGEYVATVYTEAGTTDTVVGIIGTLDFGASQEFSAANFLI